MARLTDTEKRQFTAAAKRLPANTARPPAAQPVSHRAYVEFVTSAAKFDRSVKPVRFIGDNWKL